MWVCSGHSRRECRVYCPSVRPCCAEDRLHAGLDKCYIQYRFYIVFQDCRERAVCSCDDGLSSYVCCPFRYTILVPDILSAAAMKKVDVVLPL